MIKANDLNYRELRCGNWVKFANVGYWDDSDIGLEVEVRIAHYQQIEKYYRLTGKCIFEPIELTADVLGKIKDVKVESDKRFLYDTADWSIYFVKAELPKWELHWLQNYIYFRTGTELSITL